MTTTLLTAALAMNMTDFIRREDELLPAPRVAMQLNSLLRLSPFNEEIIKVVRCDPALSARLLRVCNTAVFRGREGVSSLEEGVNRLGFENILRIVWKLSIGSRMAEALPVYGLSVGTFWRHCITVSFAAEELARLPGLPRENVPVAFTAGLLHDVGKVLINGALYARGLRLNFSPFGEPRAVTAVEEGQFGCTHADVGAHLLRGWNLPEILCDAVAWHHDPDHATSAIMASIVHLADICSHTVGSTHSWADLSVPMVSKAMGLIGAESGDLERVIASVRLRADEIEVFMSN